MVERFNQSLKYEHLYREEIGHGWQLAEEVDAFLDLYNDGATARGHRLQATPRTLPGRVTPIFGGKCPKRLTRDTLTIRRTLSETKAAGLTFKEPKTKTSRRTVTLPAFACETLSQHKEAQDARREQLGDAYKDEGLVFPAEEAGRGRLTCSRALFAALVDKQDLPRVRFHDLRHGHITQLLLRGVPLKVVSARAGHSGIAITADIYGHLLPGADAQAAAKLDDAYGARPAPAPLRRTTADGTERQHGGRKGRTAIGRQPAQTEAGGRMSPETNPCKSHMPEAGLEPAWA